MKIQVTDEDIFCAQQGPVENPVTCALRRVTGRKWFIFRGETASEMEPPYRYVSMPYEVHARWQHYRVTGTMEPFEFEFDITHPSSLEEQRRADRRGRDRRQGQRRNSERRRSSGNGLNLMLHLRSKRRGERRGRDRRQGQRRTDQRRRG